MYMLVILIINFTDDLHPESFLDYKMRGENLDNHGQIQWTLTQEHFQGIVIVQGIVMI